MIVLLEYMNCFPSVLASCLLAMNDSGLAMNQLVVPLQQETVKEQESRHASIMPE